MGPIFAYLCVPASEKTILLDLTDRSDKKRKRLQPPIVSQARIVLYINHAFHLFPFVPGCAHTKRNAKQYRAGRVPQTGTMLSTTNRHDTQPDTQHNALSYMDVHYRCTWWGLVGSVQIDRVRADIFRWGNLQTLRPNATTTGWARVGPWLHKSPDSWCAFVQLWLRKRL